mmetsp:Transcript_16783/g.22004  ORF Transcript_16783/g.22004 Transcript_16783/m.22004 type:complete len:282 (+) Transcript_16783:95-940(+)
MEEQNQNEDLNQDSPTGLDYYRQNHKWQHEIGISKKDVELAEKEQETDDERILDLVLIMDITSSMGPFIDLAKNTFKQAIEDTLINYPELDVRVAVVGYRDFCDKEIFYIHDFTFDLDKIKSKISRIQPKGGGDIPEDVQGAFRMGLELQWRKNSIKLAYFIADAPCHGSEYHTCTDSRREGNPAGLVLEDIIREYSDREIDVSCYKLTNKTEIMFKVMQTSFDEGKHKGDFQFIDLRREVTAAKKKKNGLRSDVMVESYSRNHRSDFSSRLSKHSIRRGW